MRTQVLKLVEDQRNHPLVQFIANGLPIVIAPDDPALWGISGVSYDLYVALMASSHAVGGGGVKLLKQLALNSINYSALAPEPKAALLAMWQRKWDAWIDELAGTVGAA